MKVKPEDKHEWYPGGQTKSAVGHVCSICRRWTGMETLSIVKMNETCIPSVRIYCNSPIAQTAWPTCLGDGPNTHASSHVVGKRAASGCEGGEEAGGEGQEAAAAAAQAGTCGKEGYLFSHRF